MEDESFIILLEKLGRNHFYDHKNDDSLISELKGYGVLGFDHLSLTLYRVSKNYFFSLLGGISFEVNFNISSNLNDRFYGSYSLFVDEHFVYLDDFLDWNETDSDKN